MKIKTPPIPEDLADEHIVDDWYYEDVENPNTKEIEEVTVDSCYMTDTYFVWEMPFGQKFNICFTMTNDTIGELVGSIVLEEKDHTHNYILVFETEVLEYVTREELKSCYKIVRSQLISEYKKWVAELLEDNFDDIDG